MKNLLFSGLAVLLFSGLLTNCKKTDDPSVPVTTARLGDTVEIAYQQTAIFDPGGLHLKFNAVVSDNRCPLDVTCIVAGHVDVMLNFTLGTEKEEGVLRLGDQMDEGSDQMVVWEYNVKLIEVLPYPPTTEQIPNANYKVKVVVTK